MRREADRRLSQSFDNLSALYEKTIEKLVAENGAYEKEQAKLEERLKELNDLLEKERVQQAALVEELAPLNKELQGKRSTLASVQQAVNIYSADYQRHINNPVPKMEDHAWFSSGK